MTLDLLPLALGATVAWLTEEKLVWSTNSLGTLSLWHLWATPGELSKRRKEFQAGTLAAADTKKWHCETGGRK